jgi:hypothetical protein
VLDFDWQSASMQVFGHGSTRACRLVERWAGFFLSQFEVIVFGFAQEKSKTFHYHMTEFDWLIHVSNRGLAVRYIRDSLDRVMTK